MLQEADNPKTRPVFSFTELTVYQCRRCSRSREHAALRGGHIYFGQLQWLGITQHTNYLSRPNLVKHHLLLNEVVQFDMKPEKVLLLGQTILIWAHLALSAM